MSYVIAAPETMTATATDLATIGSNLSAAHMAAAPTVAVVPAAADEVSASIAHLFSQYGGGFQALAGKASVFHDQFVHNLKASAGAYTSAEATNAALLPPLIGSLFSALALSLPQQLQQLLATLAGFVLAPLEFGILIAVVLIAALYEHLSLVLAQFGL
jgi:PE family